jgi:GNAT superfamily N-acetyltransferase
MHARDDVIYLSLERAGELDGFILLVLDPDGESVELRRIAVVRKDGGTGQAALAAAERHCAGGLGRRRIWLDVARQNARAKHVYGKLGYVPFEAPPGAEPDLEFLEKRIVPSAPWERVRAIHSHLHGCPYSRPGPRAQATESGDP